MPPSANGRLFSMAEVPVSVEPGEAPPAAPDQPPGRRGRLGRRARLGIAAFLVAAVALVAVGLATRDPSDPALERADVGAIASDVVGKAIEDLRSSPATSVAGLFSVSATGGEPASGTLEPTASWPPGRYVFALGGQGYRDMWFGAELRPTLGRPVTEP